MEIKKPSNNLRLVLPKELPEDSVDQSLEMLRGIQVVNEVDMRLDVGSCEWYMNDYLDLIERDYKHGWSDRVNNRSNLCTSDAYMQGYQDCHVAKAISTKNST